MMPGEPMLPPTAKELAKQYGLRKAEDQISLGKQLLKEIRVGEEARAKLRERWETHEKMFRNDPDASGCDLYRKMSAGVHTPLLQPLVSSLVKDVRQALFGRSSYVSVQAVGSAERYAVKYPGRDMHRDLEGIEKFYNMVIEKSELSSTFFALARDAALCGVGFCRVYQGPSGRIEIEAVRPWDVSVYPPYVKRLQNAKTVSIAGARFRLSEIKAAYLDGTYMTDNVYHVSDAINEYEASVRGDRSVCVYDVVTQITKEDYPWVNPSGLYRVLLTDEGVVLRCERFPYDPWLVCWKFREGFGHFWPVDSVAYDLQQLQHSYSMLVSQMTQAGVMRDFPPAFIIGATDSMDLSYSPGEVQTLDPGADIKFLQVPGASQTTVFQIQMLERIASSVVRVSPLNMGRQAQSETTATEASLLAGTDDMSAAEYVTSLGLSMRSVCSLILGLAKAAVATETGVQAFLDAYSDDVFDDTFPDCLGVPHIVVPRGQSLDTGLGARRQDVELLMMVINNPAIQQALMMAGYSFNMEYATQIILGNLNAELDINKLIQKPDPLGGITGGQVPGDDAGAGGGADIESLLASLGIGNEGMSGVGPGSELDAVSPEPGMGGMSELDSF